MAVACFSKQLLRCAGFKLIGKRARPVIRTLCNHELRELTRCSARESSISRRASCSRNFHTTNSAMVLKILTADEMFARKSLQDYLRTVETEYNECLRAVNAADLQTDDEELRAKRMRVNALGPLVQKISELQSKQRDFEETESLLKENDPDLHELAETEREHCLASMQETKQKILSLLVPEEESDMSDLVLEVTAGIGGQEAMLFTAEIFDMYQSYAAFHGWGFDTLEYMPSDIGGVRHATASISGPLSYKKMKFEAGVHRVQRVPKTEKQGRMHTSTMTVAILPQPAEISFTINPKDLRIETKRASGAGGQHVNTTDSAVRIVHLPTGTVSECQQERSQIKNKEKAMKLLRAKLYSAKLEEETSKRYQARKLQIGTKGRSEKIRTYNFAQDRVTDHRIGKTLHDVHGFLLGEELLDEMSMFLQQFSEQEALMDILEVLW
ncbi:peptide chain release factor 1-like, mitochondrial isoform X1 [Pangasianodon hypophthalmus]|uniref:peptide chain release factor 1-like, mitochondrial isoform X1 n=1 Tax=Pangasianodon hypophthalmus TaxID=310915 RepID=UPI000F004937|nr:peptide chain release factor 1-like, mitochondrial isoform X1 [Pangasianodon hypophthalmus]